MEKLQELQEIVSLGKELYAILWPGTSFNVHFSAEGKSLVSGRSVDFKNAEEVHQFLSGLRNRGVSLTLDTKTAGVFGLPQRLPAD